MKHTDQRTSFVGDLQYSNRPITISGFTMGWTYKDRFRIGWGGYFVKLQSNKLHSIRWNPLIAKQAPNALFVIQNNIRVYLVQDNTEMYYITPSFEYIYFKSKWLDLSIPFEIGAGYSKISMTDYISGTDFPILNKKGEVIKSESIFFPGLIGAAAMINLSRDVGFSMSIGYRKILQEIGTSANYDGIYYQFGLQLFPANIKNNLKKDIRHLKEKRKKRKEDKKQQK